MGTNAKLTKKPIKRQLRAVKSTKGVNFGEWAKTVSGMVRSGKAICPPVKVSPINYLIDAGPLVALLDGSDQWHRWSSDTLTVLAEPRLATTETALAEACHLLSFRRSAVLAVIEMVKVGVMFPVPTLADESHRIGQLLKKYPHMDMGDATLVVLSERYPKARLLTIDRKDFTIYRRMDGTPVPCIMPPV